MSDESVAFAGELGKAIGENLPSIFPTPFKTLDNIFYFVFGNFNKKVDMRKLRNEYDVERFKESLKCDLNQIKSEDIIEPNALLLQQTVENSKYSINDENLSAMFSKLISAYFDKSKAPYQHPSFGELLKQLSPLDCVILDKIYSHNNQRVTFYSLTFLNESCKSLMLKPIIEDDFLNLVSDDNDAYYTLEVCFANLIRLGILEQTMQVIGLSGNDSSLIDSFNLTEFNDEALENSGVKQIMQVLKSKTTEEIIFNTFKTFNSLSAYGKLFYKSCHNN